MKILFLLVLFYSISNAACRVADVIQIIRPGAQWTISDDDRTTLVWNSTQTIPTVLEIQTAISTCQTDIANRLSLKQQARQDVKNAALTPAQRLQALLILLDYDK